MAVSNKGKEFKAISDSPIETVAIEHIAGNKFVDVYMDTVRFTNGTKGTHLRIDEPNQGTVIIIIDPSHRLYIHEVYHYSANSYCLEFIRGYGESNEDAEKTAVRELKEEAGFKYQIIGEPILAGYVLPNSTLLMSRIPIFLIKVKLQKEDTVPNDKIERPRRGRWKSSEEIEQCIRNGNIEDGFTLSAYTLAKIKKML